MSDPMQFKMSLSTYRKTAEAIDEHAGDLKELLTANCTGSRATLIEDAILVLIILLYLMWKIGTAEIERGITSQVGMRSNSKVFRLDKRKETKSEEGEID